MEMYQVDRENFFDGVLVSAVSTGSEFLGRKTKQGKVLFLTLEDRTDQVVLHLKNIGAEMGQIKIKGSSITKAEFQNFISILKEYQPSLIIFDPLIKAFQLRDINDYSKSYKELVPIMEAAHEIGCHIMAIHHFSKADRNPQGRILGSTALAGNFETLIYLEKKDGLRYLSSESRYGEEIQNLRLAFNKKNKSYSTSNEPEPKTKIQILNDSILEYLSETNDWVTRKQIRECIGGKTETLNSAIESLVTDELVEKMVEKIKTLNFSTEYKKQMWMDQM